MKTLFIISLLVFVWGNSLVKADNHAIISGKATPGTKVLLQYDRGMVRTEAEDKADDSGNFSLNCPLDRSAIYTLTNDGIKGGVPVFIQPGSKVTADLTKENVVFSGDGIKENQFLQQVKSKKDELSKKYPQNMTDVVGYKTAALKCLEEVQKFVAGAPVLDTRFTGILKTSLAVEAYRSLLKYPFIYQLITKGEVLVLPQGYYDFLPQVDLTSPYLANIGYASSFLQELFAAMESEGYLQAGMTDYLEKRAARLKDPVVREEYLLYVLNIELFGYNQHLGQMMLKLEPMITTAAGKAKLKEIKTKYALQAENNRHLNAGQPATDFSGMDPSGKKHRLSDYKGKVVVVDVWNTGCKPCIAEMPYLRKLEQQFAGKEVVFISISLESGVDQWKKFLEKRGIHGNQWIETAAFKSPFAKAYNVRFVPRFMVFDRKGRVVEVYAPRPSAPRLAILIDSILKK